MCLSTSLIFCCSHLLCLFLLCDCRIESCQRLMKEQMQTSLGFWLNQCLCKICVKFRAKFERRQLQSFKLCWDEHNLNVPNRSWLGSRILQWLDHTRIIDLHVVKPSLRSLDGTHTAPPRCCVSTLLYPHRPLNSFLSTRCKVRPGSHQVFAIEYLCRNLLASSRKLCPPSRFQM